MNTYAVMLASELQSYPPLDAGPWSIDRDGVAYIGIEFSEYTELPDLTGWTVLVGKEEYDGWLYNQIIPQ